MKNLTKTQKITISALAMAMYVVIMIFTQSFAFGQYKVAQFARQNFSLFVMN